MNFHTKYNPPVSKPLSFDPEKSLTFQSSKDETDINKIIDTYQKTGQLPNSKPKAFSVRYPQFGDFSGVTDYSDAVNFLNMSNSAFAELPSAIRKRFNNNPMELVKFLENAENREEAEKLGLIEKSIKIDTAVKPTEPASSVKSVGGDVGTGAKATENSVGTI